MRYRLTAEVDCDIYIEQKVEMNRGDFTFEFICDDDKRLVSVAVSKTVPENKKSNLKTTLEPRKEGKPPVFDIGGDAELHAEVVTELQAIESNLSFSSVGSLKRIFWERPEVEVIPESKEEEKLVAIPSYSIRWEYRLPPFHASDVMLVKATHPKLKPLSSLKAFWREGINSFRNRLYVQAFYNFYFIIEDLYADGRVTKKGVLTAFSRSREFFEFSEAALKSILEPPGRHTVNLEGFLREEKCSPDVPGLQKLLYRVRGNLHHYFSKSPRTRGTPFNRDEFETLAFLLMEITSKAIWKQIEKINQE